MLNEQICRAFSEKSQARDWAQTFDAVYDSICILDGNCVIKQANKATEPIIGRQRHEIVGHYCWQIFHGSVSPHSDCPAEVVRQTKKRSSKEIHLGDKWFDVVVDPILGEDGELTGFVHVVRDISERRKNELILTARMRLVEYSFTSTLEEFLQQALDEICVITNSPIGFYHFVEADQQTLSLQAWSTRTRQEYCTATGQGSHYPVSSAGVWVDCVHQRAPVIHNDYEALQHKKRLPEGHAPLIRELVVPVLRNDKIVAILGIGNKPDVYDETDVKLTSYLADMAWELTAHKQVESRLRASEAKFKALADSSPLAIYMSTGLEQKAEYINPTFFELFGYSYDDVPSAEQWWPRAYPDEAYRAQLSAEWQERVSQAIANNSEIAPIESVVTCKDGSQKYISWGFKCIGEQNWTFGLDLTERRKTEETLLGTHNQLLQQDKMATIGQLAAGVAHEINNPVGFISSNLSTLEKYVEKYHQYIQLLEQLACHDDPGVLPVEAVALRRALKLDYVERDIVSLLAESIDGADRVTKIVQDLKVFSRVDTVVAGDADINKCLDSTVNIVWNEIKYVAELTRDYGDIPHIACNAQKLNQVFLNLLVNAVHAIQANGKEGLGSIVIRTSVDQQFIVIAISDDGCGIGDENKKHLFEPFFTTKEVGRGTGLGLSISAEIIRKHGGEIGVESEVGIGTTFSIKLPLNQHTT
jgi:PAS domain S-box-containing protein